MLVSAGRLFIEGNSAVNQQNSLGPNTYTVNSGATLAFNGASFTTSNSIVVNSGANIVNRQNTVELGAASTTLPTSGTIILNQDSANTSVLNLATPLALTGNLTVQTGGGGNGGAPTFTGGISGAGFGLIKTGPGMVRLSGTNTYTGLTQVNTGAFTFTTPSAIPGGLASFDPTDITVESGAVLGLTVGNGAGQFNKALIDTVLAQMGTSTATTGMKPGSHIGLDTTANSFNLLTPIGDLSGGNSIGLSKLGVSNSLILESSNNYTGGTTVYSGTLQIGNAGTTGMVGAGTVKVLVSGNLQFNRNDEVVVPNLINGGTIGALTQVGAGQPHLQRGE